MSTVLACVVGACGGAPSPADLAALPDPRLDGVDPAVAEQLQASRSEVAQRVAAFTADDEAGPLGEALGDLAMQYHAYGFADAAEVCYGNALTLDPDSLRWRYALGRLLTDGESPERGVAALQAALALDPDHLPSLLVLGQLLLDLDSPGPAAAHFDRALALDARSAAARIGLGRIAALEDDHERAVEHLLAALRFDPSATEAHYPLGLSLRALGDDVGAAEHLRRRGRGRAGFADPIMEAVRSQAGGGRNHLNRGNEAFLAGDLDGAREHFRAAVEGDPGLVMGHVNLGTVLNRLDRPDEALARFREAERLDPEHPLVQFGLGRLLNDAGDHEAAVAHYQRSIAADPNDADVHLNLANTLRRTGAFEVAAQHYGQVVALAPAHGPARLGRALALARLERWPEVVAVLEASHAALPAEDPLTEALIRVWAACPVDAIRAGTPALALAQTLTSRRLTLGAIEAMAMALAEVGRFEEAASWQSRGVSAARGAGRDDLVAALARNLSLYESGLACRQPWAPDGPELNPPRN